MVKRNIILKFLVPAFIALTALFSIIFIPLAINRNKHKGVKNDITINLRIADFSKTIDFNENLYDKNSYIKSWYGTHKEEKMIPYTVEKNWKIEHTSVYTLGDLLDEINRKNPEEFKFNLPKSVAGPMGRMLYGVKKLNASQSSGNSVHNSYWGIHEEQNSEGEWIYTSDSNYSYISLSSPNNEYAKSDSDKYFDLNESFWAYDGRISRGIDNIYLSSHNIINLNMWRMV